MIFANVTLVHMADTLEQLDADTETLQAIGNESLCQFSVLRYQQEDGLQNVNGQHEVPGEVGQVGNHAVLDVAGVLPEEQDPAHLAASPWSTWPTRWSS